MIGQTRADIFKMAIFVQNNVRSYELLKIIVFCQKREKKTTWQNILTVWPEACAKKGAQLLIYSVLKS